MCTHLWLVNFILYVLQPQPIDVMLKQCMGNFLVALEDPDLKGSAGRVQFRGAQWTDADKGSIGRGAAAYASVHRNQNQGWNEMQII